MVVAASVHATSLARRSRRLLWVGFALAMVVPAAIALLSLHSDRMRFREQAARIRADVARAFAADLDRAVAQAQRKAAAFATGPLAIAAGASPTPDVLDVARAALARELPEVFALAVADNAGKVRAALPAEAAHWLLRPSDHPAAVLTTPPGRAVALELRQPVPTPDGTAHAGILALALPLASLMPPLQRPLLGASVDVDVRAVDGSVLAQAGSATPADSPTLSAALWGARHEGEFTQPAADGHGARDGAFVVCDSVPMVVTVVQDDAEVIGDLARHQRILFGADGLLMVLGGVLIALSARSHRAFERREQEMRGALQAVVQNSGDAIFLSDRHGRYVLVNQAAADLAGAPAGDIDGRSPADFFDASTVATFAAHDAAALDGGRPWLGEETICRNGVTRVYSSMRAPVRDVRGAQGGLVAVLRDMTAQREAQRALAANERRFRHLFEHSLGLIWLHGPDGTLSAVNPAAARNLGYSVAALQGIHLADLVPPAHRAALEDYLARMARDGQAAGLLHLFAKDRSQRIWSYENRSFADGDETPYLLGYAQDVTERELQAGRLRDQALRDPLTHCWNRRYLIVFEHSHADSRWACIEIDIDHFKILNDTHGHATGDRVLAAVAAHLRSLVRAEDAVVRMGGDEFLVLLSAMDSAAGLELFAQRLESAGACQLGAGFSLGLALRVGEESLESTIQRADADLYRRRQARRTSEADGSLDVV